MVQMQMCNPQIDHFDWIKMKGQLRLVLRIEHCPPPGSAPAHDNILYYNTSLMIQILSCVPALTSIFTAVVCVVYCQTIVCIILSLTTVSD